MAHQMGKESANFQLASELGGLELLDAKYTNQNFSRHSHEGYTIGVIERGAQETDFHDQSLFHRHFKRAMGVTPKQFQS